MAVQSTIDKKEMQKLIKKLNEFPEVIQKRITDGSLRAAAKVVKNAAVTYAPLDTGRLRDSIKVKKKTKREMRKDGDDPETETAFYVGIDTDICWYANIVEFGSIKMSADPFMVPAFENSGMEALDAMKKYFKQRVEKEAEKM